MKITKEQIEKVVDNKYNELNDFEKRLEKSVSKYRMSFITSDFNSNEMTRVAIDDLEGKEIEEIEDFVKDLD